MKDIRTRHLSIYLSIYATAYLRVSDKLLDKQKINYAGFHFNQSLPTDILLSRLLPNSKNKFIRQMDLTATRR